MVYFAICILQDTSKDLRGEEFDRNTSRVTQKFQLHKKHDRLHKFSKVEPTAPVKYDLHCSIILHNDNSIPYNFFGIVFAMRR
jgi:hypothetical protein